MSAELLRRAADLMVTDDERWHPVGDWLNAEAATFEKFGSRIMGSRYDIDGQTRPGYWLISNLRPLIPQPNPRAVAVARAYLGEVES